MTVASFGGQFDEQLLDGVVGDGIAELVGGDVLADAFVDDSVWQSFDDIPGFGFQECFWVFVDIWLVGVNFSWRK